MYEYVEMDVVLKVLQYPINTLNERNESFVAGEKDFSSTNTVEAASSYCAP